MMFRSIALSSILLVLGAPGTAFACADEACPHTACTGKKLCTFNPTIGEKCGVCVDPVFTLYVNGKARTIDLNALLAGSTSVVIKTPENIPLELPQAPASPTQPSPTKP